MLEYNNNEEQNREETYSLCIICNKETIMERTYCSLQCNEKRMSRNERHRRFEEACNIFGFKLYPKYFSFTEDELERRSSYLSIYLGAIRYEDNPFISKELRLLKVDSLSDELNFINLLYKFYFE